MEFNKLAFTTLFFVSFYASLEIYYRKRPGTHPEITRKVAHILSGIFAVFFSLYLSREEFLEASVVFLIFFSLAKWKNILHSINITYRNTLGEITYPLGIIFIALSFYDQRNIFIAGLLIIAIPDALAGLTGFLGKSNNKSWRGSVVYFFTTLLILVFVFNFNVSLSFALYLTATEALSPWGSDNITVPLTYIALVGSF